MATTTARTRADVDNMTARDRLWDSLSYSYGKKRENSDEQFRQAYSQADRQMLSRGMQRSSYGAQTLANIDKQRVDAQNDIFDAQIADYENRLRDIENQEQEQARWQAQFDEGVRQYNTNLAFQQAQADTQKEQWQKNFDADRGDTAWNQAFQERQFEAGRSDTAWNQAFQREQADTQKNQWNATFNYQQQRDAVSDTQWQKAFDQSNANTDRQLAAGYVQQIIAMGNDPTDDLLARAGLSRADANAMKAAMLEGGGGWGGGSSGGGRSGNRNDASTPPPASDGELDGLLGSDDKSGGKNKLFAGVATRVAAQNNNAAKGTATSSKSTGAKVLMRKKTK